MVFTFYSQFSSFSSLEVCSLSGSIFDTNAGGKLVELTI